MKARLTFSPDGRATGLYTELIDLRTLGRLHCRRASTVEFNGKAQQWEVRRPGKRRVLFRHRSRQACLDWELSHLQ